MVRPPKTADPKGELSEMKKAPLPVTLDVDSFDGKIHVEGEQKRTEQKMGKKGHPLFLAGNLWVPYSFSRPCDQICNQAFP